MLTKRLIRHRITWNILRHCSTNDANHNTEKAFIQDEPKKELTRPQVVVKMDEKLMQYIDDKKIHPRKHPGANLNRAVTVPEKIVKAMHKAIGDHPPKQLCNDAKKLDNYLKARHIPVETTELKFKSKSTQEEVESKLNVDVTALNEDQIDQYNKIVEKETLKLLKSRVFAWKPLDYDEYRSRMYMFARSAQDYASILSVMKEIQRRDPKFQPRSFLDFGSGVGTGIWSASALWGDSIYEYYNVDSSAHMNDLSELILKDGDQNKQVQLKNVYYRQFLGAPNTSYDLVLSAFSLIELPNRQTRTQVLANLLARCTGYLILIELGTNTGFKLIKEARDFILKARGKENSEEYIFAPCPHELKCPRHKANDGTPCNFGITYYPLPFFSIKEVKRDKFSYVVFKKGSAVEDPHINWNRLVRETIVKPRHTFVRLCTTSGKLREVIFTPGKHGKHAYQCARCSRWGDSLPIEIRNLKDGEKI